MSVKKDKKQIRYIMVKDGNIVTGHTDDFIAMLNKEYGSFFDSTDYLFERHPDIRVFVKDGNLFSESPSVYYYQDKKLMMTFNGTVFFCKLGISRVRSLSRKEISFLLKNLRRRYDDGFAISCES